MLRSSVQIRLGHRERPVTSLSRIENIPKVADMCSESGNRVVDTGRGMFLPGSNWGPDRGHASTHLTVRLRSDAFTICYKCGASILLIGQTRYIAASGAKLREG